MNTPRPTLFGLALCALAVPAFAHRTPAFALQTAQAAKPADAELHLKDDIDNAMRWLRYAQDRESGSYAKSVETTSLVLRAMILSPRRYQKLDGPFVERALQWLVTRQQADGSIVDANAKDPESVKRQTRFAAAALALHNDPASQPALMKALAFIGAQNPPAEPWDDAKLPENKDALRAAIQNSLAKRDKEGAWDGPRGKEYETATAAMTMIRALPILTPPEAAKPAVATKPLPAFEPADRDKASASIQRGTTYLAQLADKGRYGAPGKPDARITARPGPTPVVRGRAAREARARRDRSRPHVARLAAEARRLDPRRTARELLTSAVDLALARRRPRRRQAGDREGAQLLVALQADEGEGYASSHRYYGGNGYGDEQRPDLSNVQMALEALSASGLEKPDNAAYKRALLVLQRCQNRSESNDI